MSQTVIQLTKLIRFTKHLRMWSFWSPYTDWIGYLHIYPDQYVRTCQIHWGSRHFTNIIQFNLCNLEFAEKKTKCRLDDVLEPHHVCLTQTFTLTLCPETLVSMSPYFVTKRNLCSFKIDFGLSSFFLHSLPQLLSILMCFFFFFFCGWVWF